MKKAMHMGKLKKKSLLGEAYYVGKVDPMRIISGSRIQSRS